VLGGIGPEVAWDPDFKANPLRSGRRVSFRLSGRKSALFMADQRGAIITTHLSPDARKWYDRHLERESELDELIQDSAYGGKAAASGTYAGLWIFVSTSEGILVAAGGTALGLGIIYAAGQSGSTDPKIYTAGLLIIPASWAMGMEIAEKGYDDSTRKLKKALDPSPYYRYVRYLPEYLWVGWSDRPVAFPVKVSTPYSSATIQQPGVVNGVSVSIAHLPDSSLVSCHYGHGSDAAFVLTEPDIVGRCPDNPHW
jgi:hypothetical protein